MNPIKWANGFRFNVIAAYTGFAAFFCVNRFLNSTFHLSGYPMNSYIQKIIIEKEQGEYEKGAVIRKLDFYEEVWAKVLGIENNSLDFTGKLAANYSL